MASLHSWFPYAGVAFAVSFVVVRSIGAAQYPGWLIPDGGRDEKSPLASVADAANRGRALYVTESILFYKVWNGHAIQLRTQVNDMPAFQGKLSRDEAWAVVEYLKVLRTPGR